MKEVTLYHGSTTIVEHPIVRLGLKDLDFGPGFYLTPLYDQAVRWAKRVRIIRKAEQAVVNTYKLTTPTAYKRKCFEAYDEEWLNFIVDSRTGKRPWEGFDIVEGGVADDRVIDAVEAYINGYADISLTLSNLAFHKPNWQICILSQSLIDMHLRFLSHDIIP